MNRRRRVHELNTPLFNEHKDGRWMSSLGACACAWSRCMSQCLIANRLRRYTNEYANEFSFFAMVLFLQVHKAGPRRRAPILCSILCSCVFLSSIRRSLTFAYVRVMCGVLVPGRRPPCAPCMWSRTGVCCHHKVTRCTGQE